MKNTFIHETSVIDQPCTIEDGTKIWHFCHLMPNCHVGPDCILGQNVFIGRGVRLGKGVKIQNNVSVYTGVEIEDGVFLGPSVVFTNVRLPRALIEKKHLFEHTLVKKGATIGANATIICGVTIGEYAFVGAGSVVTKDVKDRALVQGNPARQVGWMCVCGKKLFKPGMCPECDQEQA